MEENEIFEILNSYKEAIDLLLNRCDEIVTQNNALEERLGKLEGILFDEILEPARLALEADERDKRFADFNDKYGEKLGAYDKVIGAAEGDPDFSMARTAFDEYEKLEEPRPEENVFVDGLIETVEEQIEGIKESLGLPPDSETVIKQDEDGNTTIESDGEVVAEEEVTEGEKSETETEEGNEEGQGVFDFEEDEEKEDDPEEVRKFEEELEKLNS